MQTIKTYRGGVFFYNCLALATGNGAYTPIRSWSGTTGHPGSFERLVGFRAASILASPSSRRSPEQNSNV